MAARRGEAEVGKEIAEVILEASAFIGRRKDQECAALGLQNRSISDRHITRTLRLLESLLPHMIMLDDIARRLEQLIKATERMLNSTGWRSSPSYPSSSTKVSTDGT